MKSKLIFHLTFQLIFICFLCKTSHQNEQLATRLYHIKEVFNQLKNDSFHLTITEQLFPQKVKLIKAKKDRLKLCYNEYIGNEKVDIFDLPLRTVVEKFSKHHHEEIFSNKNSTVTSRLKTLVKTIKSLAKSVIECLHKDDEPTTLGLTRFSTISGKEFAQTYLLQPEEINSNKFNFAPLGRVKGEKVKGEMPTTEAEDCYIDDEDELAEEEEKQLKNNSKNTNKTSRFPHEYDYRNQSGVVSPVGNQGHCASCYLIAAVGAIESAYMLNLKKVNGLKNGTSIQFNEKDLFNCLGALGYSSSATICKHGHVEHVFKVASEHGLMDREKGEPYELVGKPQLRPQNCRQPLPKTLLKSRVRFFCKKSNLPASEYVLKALLIKYGPVVVSFRATADKYFMGLKGRYNRQCPTSGKGVEPGITHTGLLVGWDRTHWIIKNSYGSKNWGIGGYLYVKRTVALSCGIFGPGSYAMIPFV